ncbi:MAG: sulfatase-like hydrolase/transferase [Coraliomargaritaceae bacterium]
MILVDDISHYAVSAYGAEKVRSTQGFFEGVPISTPRIDSLAEEGLLCNYAYTYPLCEPTRIALMSGQNNRRNYLNCKSQHASDITFGDLFQRAGYETCLVGKWKQSRGTREVPGKDYVFEFGWDEFFCFDLIGEGRRMIEPYFVSNGEVKNYRGIDPETGRRWYGPELINRYALDFIERKKDEPFFLYYSMVLMHDEHTPTLDTQPESDYDDFVVDEKSEFGHMKGDDRRYYPDMMAYTDKMVGRVLDQLDALGLAENTLVVLLGDNGSKSAFEYILPDGSTYIGYKGWQKEGGLHVPLLMRSPGRVQSGVIYDGLVYVTDILPMLCEAAEVEIPNQKNIDGISFWPQAIGQSDEPHRDAITTWYIGNHHYSEEEFILEYAFDKQFKRYAPDTMYPDGRFFEWGTDPDELAGAPEKKKVPHKWNQYRYAGLDLDELTGEQKKAYKRLGKLLDAHKYVPVEQLRIMERAEFQLSTGESCTLSCKVLPSSATRTGVIWESSDPLIASVDKFGEVRALQEGLVTISVYSWDDANPSSSNREETYLRSGIQDTVRIQVTN